MLVLKVPDIVPETELAPELVDDIPVPPLVDDIPVPVGVDSSMNVIAVLEPSIAEPDDGAGT